MTAGSLFATWYDETPRISASCQPSSPGNPCYQMYSRKSTDNGITWLADETLSDVASPLPLQPDGTVQTTYAGDYDYGSAIATEHVTSWVDGRVAINGVSQQDAFTDRELVGTPSPTPTATATATATRNRNSNGNSHANSYSHAHCHCNAQASKRIRRHQGLVRLRRPDRRPLR